MQGSMSLIVYSKVAISCGEGNDTQLQYSCLENPRDGGAWWAAVHGVAKSWTWLSNFTIIFHFPLLCIGEGNGNLLHCSRLENHMDGGAWWAAVHGVAKSWIRPSNFTFIFHSPLSCIGEGNGSPLQCSYLENPRDGEAWWAAIYGVAQSWTRLKWLSSSSSSHLMNNLQVSLKGCSSLEWLLCQVIRLCKVRIATDTGPRE